MATSFKVDLLNGLHAFGPSVIRAGTTKDAFNIAIYLTTATINAATATYTSSGEASGAGYSPGGITLTNATAPTSTGTTAYWTPSASAVWSGVTLATAFNTVLVYNSTSAGKNAVASYDIGSQTITAGVLTLSMPTNGAGTALINIA